MFIPSETYVTILSALPIICVDVLIVHDRKCLLLLRDNEPAKGTYWFPGGRILKNETIEQAALRKAREETNLTCRFISIVSTEESFFSKKENMATDIHTVNVCCELKTEDISMLKTDLLHTDYRWIDRLDVCYHEAVNHPLSLIGFIY